MTVVETACWVSSVWPRATLTRDHEDQGHAEQRHGVEDREAQPGRAGRRVEVHASAPLGQAVADAGDRLDRLAESLLSAAVRPVDLGHGAAGPPPGSPPQASGAGC